MSIFAATNPQLQIARGLIVGSKVELKAGLNRSIGSGVTEDIWPAPTAFLPWLTAAVQLDLSSNDASDTAAGAGARVVAVLGLDASFNEATELVPLNGTTPVTTTASFIRVNRTVVVQSGAYGGTGAGANVGTITVDVTGGGSIQDVIEPHGGTSEKSHYTIPNSKKGYLMHAFVTVTDANPGTVELLRRNNADIVSAPFTSTLVTTIESIQGTQAIPLVTPLELEGKSDIWFAGIGGSAGSIFNSIAQMIIIDD